MVRPTHLYTTLCLTIMVLAVLLCTFLPSAQADPPVGQLYWATETYPSFYTIRNTTLPNNGAYAVLEYACQQYPGNGTYTGVVRIDTHANDFPAQVGGYCRIKRPLIPTTMDGQLYTAYLYCNGQQRDMMDDLTPCLAPVQEPNKEANLGQPPCPTSPN